MRQRERERKKQTSYQLQTTQEDQRASCRAAPHLLLSAPAGSDDEDVENNSEEAGFIFYFIFLNSSNTRDKPAELLIHYQMCEETRLVHFTSWGKHVWAVPVGKLRGRGEGRLYEVRLMPQRAEEGETLKDIQWNSRSCSDINLLNCSLNLNNTIMHFFFFFYIL